MISGEHLQWDARLLRGAAIARRMESLARFAHRMDLVAQQVGAALLPSVEKAARAMAALGRAFQSDRPRNRPRGRL